MLVKRIKCYSRGKEIKIAQALNNYSLSNLYIIKLIVG